ncbi:MAG TPA: cupin domain-containing protein [Ramlibacter sp.]|uniref:cupin domain-containing protein n=1 Tax=Ramlibacter sp. TaxID=1917967 RepID=UPI002B949F49|nr:cupin domain-containing protein [Ramlibacter sp.]HVZ46603.1 cupin domain-containing protein [Ramlibacter sp.]
MTQYIEMTPQEMTQRVARFKDLRASKLAVIDAVIPEFEREFFSVIGRGITEDPEMPVAIPDAQDFHVAIVKAAPGKGSGLHSHTTTEVFLPLSGRWSIQWGGKGHELMLETWDVISVPPNVMRGFRNESSEDAYLVAIQGGTKPDPIEWSQQIREAAMKLGVTTDGKGRIVRNGNPG